MLEGARLQKGRGWTLEREEVGHWRGKRADIRGGQGKGWTLGGGGGGRENFVIRGAPRRVNIRGGG